ncbi:MAG: chemotaxis response regulator protein-glutamate methylesterase [Spirochaetaceae bacterium]|nr:chemotaxis response regulator protein-glutamate methylesterase [Spirochaetaceae bacterium]MBQ8352940.1 chemotaxis response regulator protein-glutamate methylesterase [Spirochaetaceae bacterium]
MENKINVLVVDDSALMRNLVSKIINSSPNLNVVATAMNGKFALEKIPQCNPDIIILDVEMPVMNGLQFLQERKNRKIDIPVIMLSSVTSEGAVVTMQCLEMGACDFIQKPSGSISLDINKVAVRLTELVTSYGGNYASKKRGLSGSALHTYLTLDEQTNKIEIKKAPEEEPAKETSREEAESLIPNSFLTPGWVAPPKKMETVTPIREPGRIEIIALGISTGGPNALREVFADLSPDIKVPMLVVQHMPAGFTNEFAMSLDSICPLEVKEAQDGDILKPGRVLIAPGNHHIIVEKRSLASIVRVIDTEPRNGHRPSVDVLFESVAKTYQNHALGIIMTGMGRDGAEELAEMRKQGARTLGQDKESSIVYGMPKVAHELGGVQKQVPLSEMAAEINSIVLANQ